MANIQAITNKLDKYEKIIRKHDKEFLKRFLPEGLEGKLLSIWWGKHDIMFYFILNRTLYEIVEISEIEKWIKEVEKK